MSGLVLVVLLGAVILACGVLSRRTGIAGPVLLLLSGVALGFAPALRDVHLPPELMLLVFLPLLLYWEAITSSLREIRASFRGILLSSTLLVAVTAAAVAATAHALGLPWGPAWVLGAALAPTDATAVGALARTLPRRTMMVLRAEGLVNDGTALVIYGVAVGVTVGEETLSAGHVAGLLAVSYVGGVAVGAAAAWAATLARRRIYDPLLSNVLTLLLPFTAYLVAELIEASGVLAVVVAGLIMSQVGPRVGSPAIRQQAVAFWTLTTYLINASLFVLVGIEAHSSVRNLVSTDLVTGIVGVAVVYLVLVVVRFAFLVASAYTIRLLDRRPSQRLRRVSNRARVVSTVAGFRGAVSLAVALSVPATLGSGAPSRTGTSSCSSPRASSRPRSWSRACSFAPSSGGPTCPTTARPSASVISRRSPPPRKPWPRCPTSRPRSAPTTASSSGSGGSTRSTWTCCTPAAGRT